MVLHHLYDKKTRWKQILLLKIKQKRKSASRRFPLNNPNCDPLFYISRHSVYILVCFFIDIFTVSQQCKVMLFLDKNSIFWLIIDENANSLYEVLFFIV